MSKPVVVEHLGTKTVALFFGFFLAFIYTVLAFFNSPVLAIGGLYNIALVTAFYAIVWTAVLFVGQILTAYGKKLFSRIKSPDIVDDLGFLDVIYFLGILLIFIYSVLSFFNTPVLAIADLYNIGLVTAYFAIVWPFIPMIALVMWAYVHNLGNKISE